MENRLLSFLIVALLGFAACNQPHAKVAVVPVTDSLMKPWIDAWNAADVEKISNSIGSDVILILPETLMNGADTIIKHWIVPSSARIRNLAVTNLNVIKNGEIACLSGLYTHNWVKNDSVVGHAKGYYSFLWKKQADDLWKLAVINLN